MKPLAIFACRVASFAQFSIGIIVLNQQNTAADVEMRL
jgi:hypothetical protein